MTTGQKARLDVGHDIETADLVGPSQLAVVYEVRPEAESHQAPEAGRSSRLVCGLYTVSGSGVQWKYDAHLAHGQDTLTAISACFSSRGAVICPLAPGVSELRFFDCATRESATIEAESCGLFADQASWGRRWGDMVVVGNHGVDGQSGIVQNRLRLLKM